MKKLLLFLFILGLSVNIFAEDVIRIGLLNGPSCIPAAFLIENNKEIEGAKVTTQKFADVPALLPKMLKNEIDIGFMPLNVAAKVYNSSGAIVCCGITGNGNLTLITKSKDVKRFEDLKGKTVYVAGQGATPEYMFKYLIEKNELNVNTRDGVTLSFSIPTAQIVPQLLADKIQYAVVPEPFATIARMKSKDVVAAIDLQSEYEYFAGKDSTYPLTVLVARKSFAEKNKDLLDAFLAEYEESYNQTIRYPKKAGELCEKLDFGLAAGVVSTSIPKANYVFVSSEYARKDAESLLNLFLANDEASIGGKLPDDGFYFR